jgi:type I restriction enzyme S subunit
MSGWNVSREVAVVPADQQKIDPIFLAFWIGAERSQRWLSKVEKGVAYTGINIEDLRTLPVAVPPLDEQREIVRRVQSLLNEADRIDARQKQAASCINRLTPSVLAKAFRAELVPQEPNDEPTSALLDRLRASRVAASKPKQLRIKPKLPMSKNDKDTIKEAIRKLRGGSFSFDELREQVAGDYDTLKDAVFELLGEPNPVLCQVFDTEVQAMRLIRVVP